MICIHKLVFCDIKQTILNGDVTDVLNDFHKKIKLMTFHHYFSYFKLTRPAVNTTFLNKTLDYNYTKLLMLMDFQKLCEEEPLRLYEYVNQTVGIPRDLLDLWIPFDSINTNMIYNVFCTVDIVLKNISPLLEITKSAPAVFFELMCVYTKIWALGGMTMENFPCVEAQRLLNIINISVGNVTETVTNWTICALTNFIRTELELPMITPRNDTIDCDIDCMFKNFTVKQIKI